MAGSWFQLPGLCVVLVQSLFSAGRCRGLTSFAHKRPKLSLGRQSHITRLLIVPELLADSDTLLSPGDHLIRHTYSFSQLYIYLGISLRRPFRLPDEHPFQVASQDGDSRRPSVHVSPGSARAFPPSTEALPPGWVKQYDPVSQRNFYVII
ncbi:hypothetical protein B0H19DRAFT_244041 [Mycena capillaripes]|nr:hypothetical protein B0H19DRAFT_244041 [Mycena capillaripes]